jgi:hypothetical protein
LPRADAGRDGKLYLAFSAAMDRFLPGAFMEAWLARESSDGVAIEALALRLDDDMEWRIAGVLKAIPARAPAVVFGAGRTRPLTWAMRTETARSGGQPGRGIECAARSR